MIIGQMRVRGKIMLLVSVLAVAVFGVAGQQLVTRVMAYNQRSAE